VTRELRRIAAGIGMCLSAAKAGALTAPELPLRRVSRCQKHARPQHHGLAYRAMRMRARPIARGRQAAVVGAVSAGGRLQQPQAGGPISRRLLETL
jgi:hypothetical protein